MQKYENICISKNFQPVNFETVEDEGVLKKVLTFRHGKDRRYSDYEILAEYGWAGWFLKFPLLS
jgi:hypothetical protein